MVDHDDGIAGKRQQVIGEKSLIISGIYRFPLVLADLAIAISPARVTNRSFLDSESGALSDRKMNQAETQGIGTSLNLR